MANFITKKYEKEKGNFALSFNNDGRIFDYEWLQER
jgi:hypothetical protein